MVAEYAASQLEATYILELFSRLFELCMYAAPRRRANVLVWLLGTPLSGMQKLYDIFDSFFCEAL